MHAIFVFSPEPQWHTKNLARTMPFHPLTRALGAESATTVGLSGKLILEASGWVSFRPQASNTPLTMSARIHLNISKVAICKMLPSRYIEAALSGRANRAHDLGNSRRATRLPELGKLKQDGVKTKEKYSSQQSPSGIVREKWNLIRRCRFCWHVFARPLVCS